MKKISEQVKTLIEHYFYTAVAVIPALWVTDHHNVTATAKGFIYTFIAPLLSYINPKSASNKAKVQALIDAGVKDALAKINTTK